MNPPTAPERVSPPYLLIVGILLGGGLLAFMLWESIAQSWRSHQAGGNIVELTTENWQQEVLQSDVPVLVDFWAEW